MKKYVIGWSLGAVVASVLGVIGLDRYLTGKNDATLNKVTPEVVVKPVITEEDKRFLKNMVMGVYHDRIVAELQQETINNGGIVLQKSIELNQQEIDIFMKEIVMRLNKIGKFPESGSLIFESATKRFNSDLLNELLDAGLREASKAEQFTKEEYSQIKQTIQMIRYDLQALHSHADIARMSGTNQFGQVDQAHRMTLDLNTASLNDKAWEKGLLPRNEKLAITIDSSNGDLVRTNVKLFDFMLQELKREELKAAQKGDAK